MTVGRDSFLMVVTSSSLNKASSVLSTLLWSTQFKAEFIVSYPRCLLADGRHILSYLSVKTCWADSGPFCSIAMLNTSLPQVDIDNQTKVGQWVSKTTSTPVFAL